MGREMKHTEIGDIPEDWEVQTFEETFRVLTNNTLSRADLNDSEGTIRNIHYGDIITRYSEVLDCDNEDIPFLNSSSLLTATAMPLQDGDVILADTAEDETVGKATEIYRLGEKKMVAGLHTIPCRVKKGNFAPRWLGYYMNSHVYHDQVLPYITGIKVSSISKSAIAETLVLVPPKPEQEAIVNALSEIDGLIETVGKLLLKIQNAKKACQYVMFPQNGQLVPILRLFGFHNEWKQGTIGYYGYFYYGHSAPKWSVTENAETPCVRYGELYTKYGVKIDRVYSHTNIPKDELVFSRGTEVLIPRVGEDPKDYTHCAWLSIPNVAIGEMISVYNTSQNPMFTAIMFNATLQEEFAKRVEGGTVTNLYYEKLIDINVCFPEKEEQDAIAKFFENLDGMIEHQEKKLKKLNGIKQGMMSELLTGKIRLV